MGSGKTQQRRKKEVPVIPGMEDTAALLFLEKLAADTGITIRSEKGDFNSGYCRVKDINIIILKKEDSDKNKINLIAQKLSENEIGTTEIPQAVIDLINQKRSELNNPSDSEEE